MTCYATLSNGDLHHKTSCSNGERRRGRQTSSPEWINTVLNETMLNNTAYTFKLDEEFVREAEIKNALNQRILEMGKYLLSKD